MPPRFNENKDQYNEHEQCNGIIKINPPHLSHSGPENLKFNYMNFLSVLVNCSIFLVQRGKNPL